MRKISQRELVEEGFGDVVRGGARAFMATKIGQAIKSDLQPISDVVSAFRGQQPKQVLKDKLKSEFYNTFNYNTVKIGKEKKLPDDNKGNSRIAIEFTANLIKRVSLSGAGDLQGGEKDPETYTAILTRTRKGPAGEYSLVVVDSSNKRVISGAKSVKKKTNKNNK